MRRAQQDLELERILVVYPGPDRFPLAPGIDAVPLSALADALAQGRAGVVPVGAEPSPRWEDRRTGCDDGSVERAIGHVIVLNAEKDCYNSIGVTRVILPYQGDRIPRLARTREHPTGVACPRLEAQVDPSLTIGDAIGGRRVHAEDRRRAVSEAMTKNARSALRSRCGRRETSRPPSSSTGQPNRLVPLMRSSERTPA